MRSDALQLGIALALAAVLVVISAWLWIAQDDIRRMRREAQVIE